MKKKHHNPKCEMSEWASIEPGALAGMMPMDRVVDALADKQRGVPDPTAWQEVRDTAAERITTIFTCGEIPRKFLKSVQYAMKVFCAELLYGRRGFSTEERNPWASQATNQEKRLRALAGGDETNEAATGGTAYTEPTQATPRRGLMA